ncbi:MAG: hypothetical protein HY592_00025 [Candidatus Omnitrophica bacterium]|nr:hypothetical protein [Candidatus Omnitrophota bacterium]
MTNKTTRKNKLLAASVAGLMTLGTLAALSGTAHAEGESVSCYGVNACKGMGDCGGKGHSCAGMNACKGQGYVKVSEDACKKIGGTTTAPQA